MDPLGAMLSDSGQAGVYQLTREGWEIAAAAGAADLACFRIDIGHAHDKADFLEHIAKAMGFPQWFGRNWDALADCLKDLSWLPGTGWVVLLEKSKHFGAGHGHEFREAMDLMGEIADYWRAQNKPFWTLIGGPEGWNSGYPAMPAPR
jgi:RNAse (barnase) inhibitor barstar